MMLNVVSLQNAKKIIMQEGAEYRLPFERLPVDECPGRVVSDDIISPENIPSFNRSTVDGYAVMSGDTFGSCESIPAQLNCIGEILMGEEAALRIGNGECVKISTGGMLPENADSVVMVENTDTQLDDFCLIFKAVSPFENVTRKGDDIKEGKTILKKGTVIRPAHIGMLLSVGVTELDVIRRVRVGIISTGDELVSADSVPGAGKIRDINSHILSAMVREWGCESKAYGIIGDDYGKILSAVDKACDENDIVLISGGSSAGTRDLTVKVISALGEVLFHGIALKPGKPTIFGKVRERAVFGLPGNPGAAFYVSLLAVKPLADKLSGSTEETRTKEYPVSTNISSNHGREEIVSVKIKNGVAEPLFTKSAFMSAVADCDGYIVVDRNTEGIKAGDVAAVHLF